MTAEMRLDEQIDPSAARRVVPIAAAVETVTAGLLRHSGDALRGTPVPHDPAYPPFVGSADGAVGQVIGDVSRPYVEAGLMLVSEAPAPTTVPGDLAWTLKPTGSEGVPVTVFGTPDTPGYLFVGDGPGYEFWEGPEKDLPLLERLLLATVEGRYRWWTEDQTSRHLLRPWRTSQRRIVVFEWQLNNGSEPVKLSQGEPFLPPEGQAAAYPKPSSRG